MRAREMSSLVVIVHLFSIFAFTKAQDSCQSSLQTCHSDTLSSTGILTAVQIPLSTASYGQLRISLKTSLPVTTTSTAWQNDVSQSVPLPSMIEPTLLVSDTFQFEQISTIGSLSQSMSIYSIISEPISSSSISDSFEQISTIDYASQATSVSSIYRMIIEPTPTSFVTVSDTYEEISTNDGLSQSMSVLSTYSVIIEPPSTSIGTDSDTFVQISTIDYLSQSPSVSSVYRMIIEPTPTYVETVSDTFEQTSTIDNLFQSTSISSTYSIIIEPSIVIVSDTFEQISTIDGLSQSFSTSSIYSIISEPISTSSISDSFEQISSIDYVSQSTSISFIHGMIIEPTSTSIVTNSDTYEEISTIDGLSQSMSVLSTYSVIIEPTSTSIGTDSDMFVQISTIDYLSPSISASSIYRMIIEPIPTYVETVSNTFEQISTIDNLLQSTSISSTYSIIIEPSLNSIVIVSDTFEQISTIDGLSQSFSTSSIYSIISEPISTSSISDSFEQISSIDNLFQSTSISSTYSIVIEPTLTSIVTVSDTFEQISTIDDQSQSTFVSSVYQMSIEPMSTSIETVSDAFEQISTIDGLFGSTSVPSIQSMIIEPTSTSIVTVSDAFKQISTINDLSQSASVSSIYRMIIESTSSSIDHETVSNTFEQISTIDGLSGPTSVLSIQSVITEPTLNSIETDSDTFEHISTIVDMLFTLTLSADFTPESTSVASTISTNIFNQVSSFIIEPTLLLISTKSSELFEISSTFSKSASFSTSVLPSKDFSVIITSEQASFSTYHENAFSTDSTPALSSTILSSSVFILSPSSSTDAYYSVSVSTSLNFKTSSDSSLVHMLGQTSTFTTASILIYSTSVQLMESRTQELSSTSSLTSTPSKKVSFLNSYVESSISPSSIVDTSIDFSSILTKLSITSSTQFHSNLLRSSSMFRNKLSSPGQFTLSTIMVPLIITSEIASTSLFETILPISSSSLFISQSSALPVSSSSSLPKYISESISSFHSITIDQSFSTVISSLIKPSVSTFSNDVSDSIFSTGLSIISVTVSSSIILNLQTTESFFTQQKTESINSNLESTTALLTSISSISMIVTSSTTIALPIVSPDQLADSLVRITFQLTSQEHINLADPNSSEIAILEQGLVQVYIQGLALLGGTTKRQASSPQARIVNVGDLSSEGTAPIDFYLITGNRPVQSSVVVGIMMRADPQQIAGYEVMSIMTLVSTTMTATTSIPLTLIIGGSVGGAVTVLLSCLVMILCIIGVSLNRKKKKAYRDQVVLEGFVLSNKENEEFPDNQMDTVAVQHGTPTVDKLVRRSQLQQHHLSPQSSTIAMMTSKGPFDAWQQQQSEIQTEQPAVALFEHVTHYSDQSMATPTPVVRMKFHTSVAPSPSVSNQSKSSENIIRSSDIEPFERTCPTAIVNMKRSNTRERVKLQSQQRKKIGSRQQPKIKINLNGSEAEEGLGDIEGSSDGKAASPETALRPTTRKRRRKLNSRGVPVVPAGGTTDGYDDTTDHKKKTRVPPSRQSRKYRSGRNMRARPLTQHSTTHDISPSHNREPSYDTGRELAWMSTNDGIQLVSIQPLQASPPKARPEWQNLPHLPPPQQGPIGQTYTQQQLKELLQLHKELERVEQGLIHTRTSLTPDEFGDTSHTIPTLDLSYSAEELALQAFNQRGMQPHHPFSIQHSPSQQLVWSPHMGGPSIQSQPLAPIQLTQLRRHTPGMTTMYPPPIPPPQSWTHY